VPAVKAGAPAPGEELVRIGELDEWAQLAFEGYKCAPPLAAARGPPSCGPASHADASRMACATRPVLLVGTWGAAHRARARCNHPSLC
jgi:hypothetical protein